MSDINPNCDGAHCTDPAGEVRVYPLGAGGNLILCYRCWQHENSSPNHSRFHRWGKAKVYPEPTE